MDHSKLRRMADQIAANLAANGEEKAIAETALHIWKFWDPRMKAAIFADDLTEMSPIGRAAIEKLKAEAAGKVEHSAVPVGEA